MSSFPAKVKKKLKNGTWYPFYNTFYEKIPVDKKEILIISRSGLALESNILAILKELSARNIRDSAKYWQYRRIKKNRSKRSWNDTELR